MATTAVNMNTPVTSILDLKITKELANSYIWSITLYSAETWQHCKVEHKYVERFEMWSWRQMEKISWTDHVRNV